jgi:hypothetical protein
MHAKPIFPGQRPDEQILLFMRRHWIVFVSSFVFVALIVAAYFGALIVIVRFTPVDINGASQLVMTTITGIGLLMGWLFLLIRFVDYYLDVWILSSERIVQIKQRSLFNRQIAEFDLSSVQDVQAKQRGVLGTFLNYGTIFVQTAGTTELFEFNYIPDPFRVEKTILDMQAKLELRAKQEIGEMVDQGGHAEPSGDAMRELRRRFPDLE